MTQLQALLNPLAALQSVAGDGAYDSKEERRYIKERGAVALIPPDENAVVSKFQPEERNEAVRFIQAHGDNEAARK